MTYRSIPFVLTILFILAMPLASVRADGDQSIPSASDITSSAQQDVTASITLQGVSNDGGSVTFATTASPAHGTLDTIIGNSVHYAPEAGYVGNDSFQYIATEGATSSAPATVTITVTAPPPAGTVHVAVFSNGILATTTTASLSNSGAPEVQIAADDGNNYPVPADSALAILHSLEGTPDFSMSDIHYDASLGLYVKCVASAAFGTGPVCDSWLYTVDGASPWDSMGTHLLRDGDTLYLYSGALREVLLDHSSIESGESVTATLKQFDPNTASFATTTGFTLGVGTPIFSAPYFLEIATSTVDGNGQAIFTLNATGTYQVGVQEDFYFPTVPIIVTEAPATVPSPAPGGGGGPSHPSFNIQNALAFLAGKQSTDGSFGGPIFTDWTAVAYGAAGGNALLKQYVQTATPPMSSITDYERHAMALEALGINPYSGTSVDYISPIVQAFDGTQIGDASSVYDDIFAFFALLHAGYSPSDTILQKSGASIISKQHPDGSWGDPDTTAAAMQALGALFGPNGFDQAQLGQSIGMASGYLASSENQNGSWNTPPNGSIDSTSWVQTMLNAAKAADPAHTPSYQSASGFLPGDYIAYAQQSDGGVRPATDPVSSRIWSTSYTIVAASGKSWLDAFSNFSKPSVVPPASSGGTSPYLGAVLGAATSTAATSTVALPNATSTPPAATSTMATASTTTAVIASTTPTRSPTSTAPKLTVKKAKPASPPMVKDETSPTPPLTAETSNIQQTTAVAPAGSNALSRAWHAILSFFSWIF